MSMHQLIGLFAVFSALPGAAQLHSMSTTLASAKGEELKFADEQQDPLNANQAGRIAKTSVGDIGHRQTRESAAAAAGIKPMARISNRVQNRVQNRISNRIDYSSDPRAFDPFAVAEDQARAVGRPR